MAFLRRNWPYLLLALTPILVLWPTLLGHAIGPFDQIRQMAPWNGPAPDAPWDVLQADGVLQFAMWRDLVLDAWSRRELPLWNPYSLAGTPLLANSQSGAFYPPHILLGVLGVPTAPAMALLAWFHLAWAGLGTHLLARSLGASRVGAAVSGMSFTLSAFMVSWTGLPSVITTVSWIPWTLAFIVLLSRSASGDELGEESAAGRAPSGIRGYALNLALMALSLAMMILGGHLQFVAYGGLAALVLALWQAFAARPKVERRLPVPVAVLGGFFVASILGGLLAAPQLMPVLQYSQYSHRRNVPTEEGYLAYQASAIKPFELVGVMHANLTGNPSEALPLQPDAGKLPAYWPAYAKRGANFAEGAIGLGPLVIGLLLLARRRFDIRRIGGMALVATIAFLLATGTAMGRLLYFMVPGWSSTGSPGRIAVLFVLAMCVLAGISATQDSEPEPEEKWRLYVPIGGMAILAIVTIYSLMFAMGDLRPWDPSLSPEVLRDIVGLSTGRAKALAAVSTLIAALSIAYWLKQGRRPLWVLLAGVAACYLLSVPQVLRFSRDANLAVEAPKHERVAVINDAWGLLVARPALLPPNTGIASRLHELGGYDSLMHRDTVKLLADILGQDPAPDANGNMMFVKSTADPAKLAEAGVTEVWSRQPLPGVEAPGPDGVYRAKLPGQGRAFTPSGPAEILEETTSRIKLRATGPGRLVLRDRNMKGWHALVDGQHVPHVGELWREVELTEGEHVVEFRYSPPGLQLGLVMGLPAWLLTLGLIAFSTLGSRRRTV